MRKMLLFTTVIVLCFFSLSGMKTAAGQVPAVQWSRALGKGEARWLTNTWDGGYALTGWTDSGAEGSAVFLAKCDGEGNLLWARQYRGNGYSCGYCVKEVRGGGLIVAGDTKSKSGFDHDVYVFCTNEKGAPRWEKNFGGPRCDYAWAVQQTEDGGFILAGGTESFGAGIYDVYLIKLDAAGRVKWEKTYGGKGSDCGYAVLETAGGGCLVAGNTESFGASSNPDIYLFRTDEKGTLLWQKTYGGRGSDYGWALLPANDGGYLIAGEKEMAGEKGAVLAPCLLKVDSAGELLWERTYGGGNAGSAYAVCRTKDRGYVLTGKKESPGGYHIFVVKTDKTGAPVAERALEDYDDSAGYIILQSAGGGYVLAGKKRAEDGAGSEISLLKLRGEAKPGTGSLALLITALCGVLALFFLLLRRKKQRSN